MKIDEKLFSKKYFVSSLLCLGLVYALAGMFYMPSVNSYKTVFYFLCLFPGVIALILGYGKILKNNYLYLLLFLYLQWLAISVIWSDSNDSYLRYLKYVIYISIFVFVNIYLYFTSQKLYRAAYLASVIFVSIAAVWEVIKIIGSERLFSSYRFIDGEILYNPLFAGAAYTYFLVFALVAGFYKRINPILCWFLVFVFTILVIQTNARTPLLSLLLSLSFFFTLTTDGLKKCLFRLLVLFSAVCVVVFLFPEYLMQRGTSYRFEIWGESLRLIFERPVFGYGLENKLVINIQELPFSLSDTHNVFLQIAYSSGAIGLAIFLVFLCTLFYFVIKYKYVPDIVIAATLVVYGLSAGLTEGGGILSRPGAYWFKFWFPISYLLAVITYVRLYEKSFGDRVRCNALMLR